MTKPYYFLTIHVFSAKVLFFVSAFGDHSEHSIGELENPLARARKMSWSSTSK